MRRRLLDALARRAIVEAKRDPRGEIPSDMETAIDGMTADEIAAYLFAKMREDAERGYGDAAKILAIEAEFQIAPHRALAALAQYVLHFAYDFAQNERAALKRIVHHALAAGAGPVELRKAIVKHFRSGIAYVDERGEPERTVDLQSWANTVSRTELGRAYNMGTMALYADAGFARVMWMAAGDPHECPQCEAADGEVVKRGDAFPSVDVDMPPAHPNCFCTIMADPGEIGRYTDPQAAAQRARQLNYYRAINQ